jgi:hypothetical protein
MDANGTSTGAPIINNAAAAFKRKRGTRAPPGPKPEEWAAEKLELGADFENVHALSVSEARLIVEAAEKHRRKFGKKLRETEYVPAQEEGVSCADQTPQ